MSIQEIATSPFEGQRPGTSGLRQKTRVFMRERYLENFVQSVFDTVGESHDLSRATLVVGGDGRFHNVEAIQTILVLAAGNGFARVLVGRQGWLSTPAVSAVIRRHGAVGGLVLSASHNPGGIDGDFGIKYNVANGGPAPAAVTEAIYARTQRIQRYRRAAGEPVDLDVPGVTRLGETDVEVIDPMADYTATLEALFDFDAMRALFARGFTLAFDAMNAITGPYAKHIFEGVLGAAPGTVLRGEPLPDFGGAHPDPNLVHAHELVERMGQPDAPDLGAASDGDGDRNMILGRNCFVSPGDSLSIIAEHASECIPGYRSGLAGIARSMPTSTAADRVAAALGVPLYETPTGWKFFGNLMDAGLCTVCGEESFGTGSNHVREKDGIWAVLCWLAILAERGTSVDALQRQHWQRFGRSYYQRHDYEALDAEAAASMYEALRARLPELVGGRWAECRVASADDFRYEDPVDGSVSEKQGLRIVLDDGSRVVCRLSGTGTQGATLRLYLERVERARLDLAPDEVLAPLARAAQELLAIEARCGRSAPDVVT